MSLWMSLVGVMKTTTLKSEINKAITHEEFQETVCELAHYLGWRIAHFRRAWSKKGWRTPVQYDGAGFPDLFLVRGERLLVMELKSAKGNVTIPQQLWLDTLKATGKCEVYLGRPDDWDEIVELLKREK